MQDKKQEIIKASLDCFVRNGLLSTSIRDIAKDIGMLNGHIYYYIKDKEELVVKCAELAIKELSENLVANAISHAKEPEKMIEDLLELAKKYMPIMKFIVSVKVSYAYGEKISAALEEFSNQYNSYSKRFADEINCDIDEVRPLVYMLIVSTTNYMIFGEASLYMQQLEQVKKSFLELLSKKN